jgi:predicted NBD/HSP70 family sugar kinase
MRIESTIVETDPRVPATWRVLSVLLKDEPLSQADLRERTGLSHPVIVQRVAQLRRAGLIAMGQPTSGKPGRPRTPMTFNWNFRRLLAVEVHRAGITVQASNLRGDTLGDARVTPLSSWTLPAVRAALENAIRAALAESGAPWAGIAVLVPGTVAADSRTLVDCAGLDAANVPLGSELTAAFGLPVVLFSDAATLACAAWNTRAAETNTVLAISLRHPERIGLGLIIDGQLIRSAGSAPGGIAQLTVGTLIADPAQRATAMRALAETLAPITVALQPDELILQGDGTWSDSDGDTLHTALQATCGAACGVRVEMRSSRAEEGLDGGLTLLSRHLLDLRQGQLADWARAAVPEPEPIGAF